MTTAAPSVPIDQRLVDAAIATLDLFGVYLGDRLGLYEVLREQPSATVGELASAAGIHERYAQEWLEHQAVTGLLTVDDASAAPNVRRYALPEAHIGALATPEHAEHLAPLARMIVGVANALEDVVAAYRSGRGVPYTRYGADFRDGQGAINRPAFTTSLCNDWLPAVPGLVDRLDAGGRIADLGCGVGWSSIAMAHTYPSAEVWGIDSDVASIEDARVFAAKQDAKVRFEAVDAAELAGHGPFDAITILEALHDMSRPVDVLRAARDALAADGSLIIADEAVADTFTAPGDDVERFMYGWSITHCLPASMAEQPSAAIGTVIREDTVRSLAQQAGFADVEVLPVDGGFFRIYRLHGIA